MDAEAARLDCTLFLLLFLCGIVFDDEVVTEVLEGGGGALMSIPPFSIASIRAQQVSATFLLKRTSMWALRISRRRVNTAPDCSAGV